jgi:Fic family protein
MEELITWVNKEDLEMHPVIKAAVFQNRFVWTPPFFDGNMAVRLDWSLTCCF